MLDDEDEDNEEQRSLYFLNPITFLDPTEPTQGIEGAVAFGPSAVLSANEQIV